MKDSRRIQNEILQILLFRSEHCFLSKFIHSSHTVPIQEKKIK